MHMMMKYHENTIHITATLTEVDADQIFCFVDVWLCGTVEVGMFVYADSLR